MTRARRSGQVRSVLVVLVAGLCLVLSGVALAQGPQELDALSSFIRHWIEGRQTGTYVPSADLNGDGRVDWADCLRVIERALGAVHVAAPDGKAWVTIPPEATPDPGKITVAPAVLPGADELLIPGTVYEFGPEGVQFQRPVELTIKYSPANLPAGAEEDTLQLYKVTDNTVQLVPGTTVDPYLHALTGQVRGFSSYGVGDPPLSAEVARPLDPDKLKEIKASCVKYVTWYYGEILRYDKIYNARCDASEYFGTAEARGLEAYANGKSNVKPEVYDILCFDKGNTEIEKWGHVAIVREVKDLGGNKYQLGLLESNVYWKDHCEGFCDQRYAPMRWEDGVFKVGRCSGSIQDVQGWLRRKEQTSLAPTVTLTADPPEIAVGQSTALKWASTNATTVVSSNFGAEDVEGTKTLSPTETTTYKITVEGPGGQAEASVTVVVRDTVEGGDSRGVTTRVSVATGGGQANDWSFCASISADGRYVAFYSLASNLVPGDTNSVDDIFVHDRLTGETTRVSVSTEGEQANGESGEPSISADGRYVAFTSSASNLVSGDTNGQDDIFVHGRLTGETTRVSVATGGRQANDESWGASISADGRYVAFTSSASNLVPGDTNGQDDIFVHGRLTGETTRVSVSTGGGQANGVSWFPSISADGRYVAFGSNANNLVPGDTNGDCGIFVHDRLTGETTRVSVSTDDGQANDVSWFPSISADGRYVAFQSKTSNLVPGDTNGDCDIFVHDRVMGQTTRVSVATGGRQANNGSWFPSISADGRYVAFESFADNLVPDDTNEKIDIFVHDRVTGQTTRVSVATGGGQTNGWWSERPSISADGRYVAFESFADNLVPDDTNEKIDVFVHDRWPWLGP